MERRKQFSGKIASLVIKGPKSIIQNTLTVDARLDRTWYQLLVEDLQLPITRDSGIFLCSLNFTPSSPREGVGFRSELNDQIGDFVNKFERRHQSYKVRLCHPDYIATYLENSIHGIQAEPIASDNDQMPIQRDRNRVRDPSPHPQVSIGRARSRTTLPSTSPLPSTSSASRFQSRGPSIVISTQHKRAASLPQDGMYRRPRYVPGSQPISNTNHKYPTRSKLSEERKKNENSNGSIDNGAGNVGANREVPSVTRNIQMQQRLPKPQNSVESRKRGDVGNIVNGAGNVRPRTVPLMTSQRREAMSLPTVVTFCPPGAAGVLVPNPSVPQVQDARSVVKREPEPNLPNNEEEAQSRDQDREPEQPLVQSPTHSDVESSDEAHELRRFVEGRVGSLSNFFFLRVKKEVAELKRNNLWDRSVSRCPYGCYFLEKIFRD